MISFHFIMVILYRVIFYFIPFYSISFYFILFYFILFYFILFYFILFYTISFIIFFLHFVEIKDVLNISLQFSSSLMFIMISDNLKALQVCLIIIS